MAFVEKDRSRCDRAVVLAVLVLAALCLPRPVDAQRASNQHILGTVLDQQTGQPIPDVQIEFLDRNGRLRGTAVSNADGRFELKSVPAGTFRLRATRLGYVKQLTPSWHVQSNETLTAVVRMDPEALVLAPLEITARSRSLSPALEGFFHRAELDNGGTFILRKEIEARAPLRITDLLVMIPGIELGSPNGQQNRVVRFSRSLLGPSGGICPVQIFVDGTLATRAGEVALDELASPGVLEGIEVHRGLSTMPPEFRTNAARCGVIALWTRRGT